MSSSYSFFNLENPVQNFTHLQPPLYDGDGEIKKSQFQQHEENQASIRYFLILAAH